MRKFLIVIVLLIFSFGLFAATVPKSTTPAFISASASSVLTNASSHQSRIELIELKNTDTSDIVVTLWFAPNDSGSVRTVAEDDVYERLQISVGANDTVYCAVGWLLSAENDSVQAKAATASKVSITVSYLDITS